MGNEDMVTIKAFDMPYSLLGVGYAKVSFDLGTLEGLEPVNCKVPPDTKHVLVAVTSVALTYGSLDAPQEAPFAKIYHQALKKDIVSNTFTFDVLAHLQNNKLSPWSGEIQLEIMCFG